MPGKNILKTPSRVAAVISTVILIISLATAPGASGASFSVTPADPDIRFFNMEINPGEEESSSALIKNGSDQPITLFVYGADGTQSNQGTFALTTRETPQKHIGLWVKTDEDSVTVEPHGSKEVRFTVSVPQNATPGIYSGGIAVEENSGKDTATSETKGNAISISARIVVKLFVNVPGEKVNKYEWQEFSYTPSSDGNPGFFTLKYKNTGNTIVNVDQKITINGFPGKEQSLDPTPAMLLQGSEVNIPVKWSEEPFVGYYTATAKISFSEYDITSNEKQNTQTETRNISVYIPLKTNTSAGMIVIGIFAFIILLIIFLLVSFLLVAGFRKKCKPYLVSEGETIISIAEKCKVNWKKLAKVNKLKAPYNIKPGQTILAPQQKK